VGNEFLFIVLNWRLSQPSRRGCNCCKLKDEQFALCGAFVAACISYQCLEHALDRFSAAWNQAGMKSGTEKTEVLSFQKTRSLRAASERQCAAAGGEAQVPCCGDHEWRKTQQVDCKTDWIDRAKAVLQEFHRTVDLTEIFHNRCFGFQIGLYSDSHLPVYSYQSGNDWRSAILCTSARGWIFAEVLA